MLCVVSFVSWQLTQQRIALEAENKLNAIQSMQSPFTWDFSDFNQQVVESFQPYWQTDNSQTLHAQQASNPQLSLNFSGQTLSTLLHDKLIIYSATTFQGQLKIQIKNELADGVFYYSELHHVSGKVIEIDLKKAWKGYKTTGENVASAIWGKELTKISSLVLVFENPNKAITINKIALPYSPQVLSVKQVNINCDGHIGKTDVSLSNEIIQFELQQKCLLPSSYMWLKQRLTMGYPESVFSIKGVKSWQQSSMHQVNKSYTSITLFNVILYAVLALGLLLVFWLRTQYAIKEKAIEQPWYQWATKQMLFKGAKTAIKPYHLLINYAVVVIPTLVVFIVMAFIDFPELQAFKKFPLYFLWALLQQFFLGYVLAQRIFYNKTENRLVSALLAAAVFSLMHAPSVTLILATFIAGGLWAYAFLVFKRLLPLALSHAVLALMFYHVVSDKVLYSAKVMQWFWE